MIAIFFNYNINLYFKDKEFLKTKINFVNLSLFFNVMQCLELNFKGPCFKN